MRFSKRILVPAVYVLFLSFFSAGAWAADKVAVMEYSLAPVGTDSTGNFIKTEWHAKLQNRASKPVSFSLVIIFVDENDKTLKETKTEGGLTAKETKTFSDTLLLEGALATRVSSTRVSIIENSP